MGLEFINWYDEVRQQTITLLTLIIGCFYISWRILWLWGYNSRLVSLVKTRRFLFWSVSLKDKRRCSFWTVFFRNNRRCCSWSINLWNNKRSSHWRVSLGEAKIKMCYLITLVLQVCDWISVITYDSYWLIAVIILCQSHSRVYSSWIWIWRIPWY